MKFRPSGAAWDVLLLAAGLVLFALLAHRTGALFAVGVAGLAAAALALAWGGFAAPRPLELFALGRSHLRRAVCFLPLALVVGLGLGVCYRCFCGQGFWPDRLHAFALAALAIGAAEEFVYRGYVYGRVRHLLSPAAGRAASPVHIWLACAVAALAHALYKGALFTCPPSGHRADVLLLAAGTFLLGVLAGLAREHLGGALSPLFAHAVFDVVVYGDRVQPPWWVWG